MKTPKELRASLSKEEQIQASDLEKQIEEYLQNNQPNGVCEFNTNETIRTISDRVWHEVVKRAQAAGWVAEIKGAMVRVGWPKG